MIERETQDKYLESPLKFRFLITNLNDFFSSMNSEYQRSQL